MINIHSELTAVYEDGETKTWNGAYNIKMTVLRSAIEGKYEIRAEYNGGFIGGLDEVSENAFVTELNATYIDVVMHVESLR